MIELQNEIRPSLPFYIIFLFLHFSLVVRFLKV